MFKEPVKQKMNFFSDAVARLKHELRVSKDGEVATALGLSKTAFAERKRRGSFPEKELHVFAEKHPELELDVGYVMNGIRKSRAIPTKSLIEIIDRFLTVYRLNTDQGDEKLSLPPGTMATALSYNLPAVPDDEIPRAGDSLIAEITTSERRLIHDYRMSHNNVKKGVKALLASTAVHDDEERENPATPDAKQHE